MDQPKTFEEAIRMINLRDKKQTLQRGNYVKFLIEIEKLMKLCEVNKYEK